MTITSLRFAGFVLAALVVYHALPRRFKNLWLLLVSYIFIGSLALQFIPVLLAFTLANYLIARWLSGRSKALLWLGIAANLLTLILFKLLAQHAYHTPDRPPSIDLALASSRFFAQLPHVQVLVGDFTILLPVGLSFLVVQAIGYLVDVHAGRVEAVRDPLTFALYLAYFPRLVSGPIERVGPFLSKLARPNPVDNAVIARSLTLILTGAFRKLVIADPLAALSQPMLEPGAEGAPALWLLAYAFSLYNDFAGYTDIVRGVSALFGIELSVNFRRPYFARTFTEFWNRWHITLSNWLRDYIFFPFSRALRRRLPNPRHPANLLLPPLITMLASGLWHGLSWHMLLWGGLHGFYLAVERVLSLRGPTVSPDRWPRWRQIGGALLVFGLVALAWVPFRLDLPLTLDFWWALLTRWAVPDPRILGLLGVGLLLDWLQERTQDELSFQGWPRLARAGVLAVVLLTIFLFTRADYRPPFVYQGF